MNSEAVMEPSILRGRKANSMGAFSTETFPGSFEEDSSLSNLTWLNL
jgi:hypothetical protein